MNCTAVKKGLPQEALKCIACASMLLDHIGLLLVPSVWLRVIGRLAFPIYCFLLSEGIVHTRSRAKYGLRLLLCALISEPVYDLALCGGTSWWKQSVMVTLLLGFLMLLCMERVSEPILKWLVAVPFCYIGELFGCDYGGLGLLLISLLHLTRGQKLRWLWLTAGVAGIFLLMPSMSVRIGGVAVPAQLFGLVALPLILAYSGRKVCSSRAVQLGFYLFYPLHLLFLLIIRLWMA